MAKEDAKAYLLKPFRVVHKNGDVVAGFDALPDAEEDATERDARAKDLDINPGYKAAKRG